MQQAKQFGIEIKILAIKELHDLSIAIYYSIVQSLM